MIFNSMILFPLYHQVNVKKDCELPLKVPEKWRLGGESVFCDEIWIHGFFYLRSGNIMYEQPRTFWVK